MTTGTRRQKNSARASWLIPTGLIMLAAFPVFAGTLRLAALTGGAELMPDHDRFMAVRGPLVVHIISVTVYCILGALQFSPGLRRRRIRWHRLAGRILVPCGLAAALTGLWLNLFIPRSEIDSYVLTVIRVVVGVAMTLAICLGFAAILRRDIARHRAWMIRGYAIGMGAGTQVLTHLPWLLIVGPVDKPSRTVLMTAGWVINVVVAEWIIRRRPAKPTRRSTGRPDAAADRRTGGASRFAIAAPRTAE